jgi:hypothetical protein
LIILLKVISTVVASGGALQLVQGVQLLTIYLTPSSSSSFLGVKGCSASEH